MAVSNECLWFPIARDAHETETGAGKRELRLKQSRYLFRKMKKGSWGKESGRRKLSFCWYRKNKDK
ncbi:unnamed protein product [Sphenostylis stenocarpa]|uniref:Uncharacterized protein n=1 Tax=Sphenostylis stenocarpa TaxID=92480 RepID=A0AA86SBW4_9FABA|nr:unnamed protein product [Sphenostylis stenocarpa]